MTRKRFVKLLMADGIQRNEAQALADRVHKKSYPVAYMLYFILSEKYLGKFVTITLEGDELHAE